MLPYGRSLENSPFSLCDPAPARMFHARVLFACLVSPILHQGRPEPYRKGARSLFRQVSGYSLHELSRDIEAVFRIELADTGWARYVDFRQIVADDVKSHED